MDITHLHFRQGRQLAQIVHIPVLVLLEEWEVHLLLNEALLLLSIFSREELDVRSQTSDCAFTEQKGLLLLILGSAQLVVRPAVHLVAIILSAHVLRDRHERVNLRYLRGAPIPGFLGLRAAHHLLLLTLLGGL